MKITYIKISYIVYYLSYKKYFFLLRFVMIYVYSKLSGPKYTDFPYAWNNTLFTLWEETFSTNMMGNYVVTSGKRAISYCDREIIMGDVTKFDPKNEDVSIEPRKISLKPRAECCKDTYFIKRTRCNTQERITTRSVFGRIIKPINRWKLCYQHNKHNRRRNQNWATRNWTRGIRNWWFVCQDTYSHTDRRPRSFV
jgi:hypothetical protein